MAEEEVTDLTDGEDSGDGKGKDKGKKKEKAPKEPKKGKEDGEKEPKVRGERKGGSLGVIVLMLLVLFLLVGGFGAALYFDALGARTVVGEAINDPLLDLVIWLDPWFHSVDTRLRAEAAMREERVRAMEDEMEGRVLEVADREALLDAVEAQISRRENELEHREAQLQAMLERAVPLHRRADLTEQEIEEMLSLSETYAQMAPEIAANIMKAMHDPRDVAGLLFHMSERNRAAIMSVMDERYAAHITEILLYY